MRCRACGAAVAETARFCHECGTRLRSAEGALPTVETDGNGASRAARSPEDVGHGPSAEVAASGRQGDRRIVTALFADLVDYVRLVAEHDAEDVRLRVEAALRAMVDAIERFDGTPEKFIGDAVFAVFGWPVAHDDDALRATHCALAIRDGVGRLEDPAGEALQVRIGLATGEVVAAPRGVPGALDWSLTGPAVTTAARIQGEAAPGEILLDDATRHAARKTLAVDDLGERVLRGQRRPVRLARLLGEAGFQPWQPPVGRFVGRALERRLLSSLVEALGERGEGAVAIVEGEPGIGKSRLLSDLEVDARRLGLAWSWVDNVSYGGGDPYRFGRSLAQAVADEHGMDSGSFVRQLLLSGGVDERDARRWTGAIAAIARDAAFSGWEAEAALVSPDPAEVAAGVRSLARGYLERLLDLDGPRVIVVDDLHWLDPSSAGIFEELVDVGLRRSLLVLIGGRPTGPVHPCLLRPEVRHLTLDGLDEPQTAELAEALAGAPVASADARRLHLRTGGNPLFIGETVRASVDEGAITEDGRLAIGGSDGADVPLTLRALLGSRIDALAPDARTVLRVGAVIGMTFREAVLEDVLAEPVEPTVYDRLADAALIVPLDGRGGWRFCHPLIHDAAYRSLLSTDRTTLHTRIADRIEARQASPPVAAVARHRAAAGDAERAIPLLLEAAEQAGSLGASAEAAGYLEMAAGLEADSDAAAAALATRRRDARGDAGRLSSPGDSVDRRLGQAFGGGQRGVRPAVAGGDLDLQAGAAGDGAGPGGARAVDPIAQLLAEVDQDGLPRVGGRCHVERLLWREVAASGIVEIGALEGCLRDDEIRAASGRREGVARARVATDRDPCPGAVGDDAAPCGHVVAARDECQRQVADVEPVRGVVLEDAVGIREEVRSLADGGRQRVESGLPAGRQEHRDVRTRHALPRQEIAERHEVDVVIGVHVADDDRVELPRIADRHELADDALTAIDEEGRRIALDQAAPRQASPIGVGTCHSR